MRILLAAIYPYAFLLLYLTIPFDNYIRALPNILLAILVIAFPFSVKKEDFKKLKSLPFILFFVLFAYLCLNAFVAGRWTEDFNIIKKVMIAVGLAVLYIPVDISDVANVRSGKINQAIIFSALAAILFSIYNFVLITDATGSFALGDSPQVVEALLIDRLYLGLLSTFSILISFQAIQKKYHPDNNYHLANIGINLVFIILIASKIAVISLVVLLLLRLCYGKWNRWKTIVLSTAIAVGIGLFFILKSENNHQITIGNTSINPKMMVDNSLTYTLRAVVWQCAQSIIEKDGFSLTGIGFDTTKDRLVACYGSQIQEQQKSERFVSARYNTHNQFIDFYISAGFLGFLLFLACIAFSFFAVRKQFFSTAMLAILVMYSMIENVFHRQIGAYYIGFILIVLITSANALQNKKTKNL